jgi:hypothetical protein
MKGIVCIAVLAAVAFASCDVNSGSTVVGSASDTQINGVSFTVDTTYVDAGGSGQLFARGTIKTTLNISAPWYIEGQFYTDSTMTVKLGGNDTEISFPLSPGKSTYWTIYFYTSSVDVRQFPDFRIGNLRAIYKN